MKVKIVFLILLILISSEGFTERVALVIGNESYEQEPLQNPVNDAKAIAKTLSKLDFYVTIETELNRKNMINVINNFSEYLEYDDVVLLYYSGHGVQLNGINYLIPLNSNIQSEEDVEFEGVAIDRYLRKLEKARINIIILDACRDNPYRRVRSMSKGLAQVSAKTEGTFIAYSTAPGTTSLDGQGNHSPYTKNLLKELERPNQQIEEVFKNVRIAVKNETNNQQIPWDSSSLTDDFIFCKADILENIPEKIEIKTKKKYKTGTMKVSSNQSGMLYLDGDFLAEIKKNKTEIIKDIRLGQHDLEMQAKGKSQKKQIEIFQFEIISVHFEISESDKMIFVEGGELHLEDKNSGNSVCIESFYVSQYEVKQNEYESLMGENPSGFIGKDLPVESVNWQKAVEFCNAKSRADGYEECYIELDGEMICDFSKNGYRLPTEAEWEFAAKGGNKSQNFKFAGSNSIQEVAWFRDNSGDQTYSVGKKKPNELGIYDMSGNVWEWCNDWFAVDHINAISEDQRGPKEGSSRVCRGGGWDCGAMAVKIDFRISHSPLNSNSSLGFRYVRSAKK